MSHDPQQHCPLCVCCLLLGPLGIFWFFLGTVVCKEKINIVVKTIILSLTGINLHLSSPSKPNLIVVMITCDLYGAVIM